MSMRPGAAPQAMSKNTPNPQSSVFHLTPHMSKNTPKTNFAVFQNGKSVGNRSLVWEFKHWRQHTTGSIRIVLPVV